MWFKILLLGLLGALAVIGIVLVNAADRMFFSNRQILQRLDALEDVCRSAGVSGIRRTSELAADGNFANAAFYDPVRVSGDRLIQATMADPGDLNSLTSSDAAVTEIYGFCHASLGDRDAANPARFQPWLAESWTESEDHLRFRIKLRRGVYWHDATDPETGRRYENVEMTAHDFRFWFDVVNNPDVNCAPLRTYYQDMVELNVIGDYEFEVLWSKPYFRSLELTLGLTPLPRHFYHFYSGPFDGKRFNLDHERNRMVVGVGPYQLDSWVRDQKIVLKRYDRYFGRAYGAMPALEQIVISLIKLENTRFQALLAGDIDVCDLTPDQWMHRTSTPQFVATRTSETPVTDAAGLMTRDPNALLRIQGLQAAYSYLAYNQVNPLFQDRRVRQALTLLVNRERILQDVYFGLGAVVAGPFQYGSPFYDMTLTPWPFDPAEAKRLLAEAGWRDTDGDGILEKDGRKFEFTMMQVANHPIQGKVLPIVKEDMAAAGIHMRLDVYEWSVFLQRIDERNFEACMLAWTVPLEADPYQVWHSSQADAPQSSNFIGFRNAEADRLIEAIRVAFDTDERIALCHQFQALLHREQPYTFLFAPAKLSGMSARYENIRLLPYPSYGTSPGRPEWLWTPKQYQRVLQ